jgi:hypothetical protein
MDKKLFRVKVVLYVMAENASAACVAATRAPFDIFECAARKADHIEAGWQDAIPYNSEDFRTCSEILANRQQVTTLSIRFPTNTGRWEPGGQTLSNFAETRSRPQ